MVQTSTLFFAAVAIAPVFAAPLRSVNAERSIDLIDARAPEAIDESAYARAMEAADLSEREIQELDDIIARDPFLGGLFKKVIGVGKSLLGFREFEDDLSARGDASEEILERDIDELADIMVRNPFLGGLFKKVIGVGKGLLGFREFEEDFAARDSETIELLERAFNELSERDLEALEDLSTRNPFLGGLFKKVIGVGKGLLGFRDFDDELLERDTDELVDIMVRNPFLGGLFKKVIGVGKGLLGFREFEEDFAARDSDTMELLERAFEELSERDLETLEELSARNPFLGGLFKKVVSVGKGLLGFRSFDDEFEARTTIDDLD
jgi:hypothetical protein